MSVSKQGISKSSFAFVIYSFVYFFIFYLTLNNTLSVNANPSYAPVLIAALNFEVVLVLVLGIFFLIRKKIYSNKFFFFAPAAIAVLSILMMFFGGILEVAIIFIAAPLFSVGLIFSFYFFQKISNSWKRGRLAGAISFIILPFVFVLTLLRQNEFIELNLGLLFLLSVGLVAAFALKNKSLNFPAKLEPDNISDKKIIFLYLLPWILFSLINVTLAQSTSLNISSQVSASMHVLFVAIQVIGVNFGAIIAGFFADFFGRRVALGLALSLYGVSAVFSGLVSNVFVFSLTYFINGLSWGFLFVLYTFVILGDLNAVKKGIPVYWLGAIIYFLFIGVGSILPPILLPIEISSLGTCLVIFFSVIPLIIVPELLPQEYLERRRINRYIETLKGLQENQG